MLQEITTPMAPAEVLAAAKTFFSRRSPIYAAFLEKEGPSYLTFRGQGGEELVIGVQASNAGTIVRGSTYLFDQQIARFFFLLRAWSQRPACLFQDPQQVLVTQTCEIRLRK